MTDIKDILSKVRIADEGEPEECAAVICATAEEVRRSAKILGRNLTGHVEEPCSKCGVMVLVAPSSPKDPPRICQQCFMAQVKPDDEHVISRAGMIDVLEALKKGRLH